MRQLLPLLCLFSLGPAALGAAPDATINTAAKACIGGAVLDDGKVDSGYSFVPSALEGTYLQYFDASLFERLELDTVCICWLKTRHGNDNVEFEVVFFEKTKMGPAAAPYAWIPAIAPTVPDSVQAAGEFLAIDVRGVSLPKDGGFIGVRWNPSQEKYLFLCNDQSEATEPTTVFYHEDRARGWANVKNNRDPIFRKHHAVMVRARALGKNESAPPPWQDPAAAKTDEKEKITLTAEPDASSPPRVAPSSSGG